jgi:hypothetical protein
VSSERSLSDRHDGNGNVAASAQACHITGRWRRIVDKQHGAESDVPGDEAEATGRPTGGDPDVEGGDNGATTGSGESGVFVGRTAGQDEGYAGQTGAEARGADESSVPDA